MGGVPDLLLAFVLSYGALYTSVSEKLDALGITDFQYTHWISTAGFLILLIGDLHWLILRRPFSLFI